MSLIMSSNTVFAVVIDYPDFSDLSNFTLGKRAIDLNPAGDGVLHLIDLAKWKKTSDFELNRFYKEHLEGETIIWTRNKLITYKEK